MWSEERGKVVEFSPVSNQNISFILILSAISRNTLTFGSLMSSTKCYCLHVIWFHMIFVPKLSLDLVLIIYFRNGAQGNETDSRPSSRAGSPSKFRKISGGSLSRYSTKDECLLLRLIAFQLQLYLFWQMMWLWGSRGKCWSVVLSNYRSESMNNLDWSSVEDEKDKRIRELEDTLRKQKELMEILQVHVWMISMFPN